MPDLTAELEDLVGVVLNDMASVRKDIEEAVPRPFGDADVPLEEQLQRYHQAVNMRSPDGRAVGMRALQKIYGSKALVEEVKKLHPEYVRRLASAEEVGVSTGPPSPETAVG